MNDANGHVLNVGDIVKPANIPDNSMVLRLDEFDGTLTSCRFKDAVIGPAIKYLPVHLVWISTPTP